MPWLLLYARATFCQFLRKDSIITDEETPKDNNQIWQNHFSFEIIRRGMFDMWWPIQVFTFRILTFKSTWWDNKFYIGALNEERCVKMIVQASGNLCILNFRDKKRKTLPSSFGLTDLSDYLLLYQIIALGWLDLKHPYFVLQPYCPLLTIAVAPKFHSGSSLIFVFPSVIHTKTLTNFWKKYFFAIW